MSKNLPAVIEDKAHAKLSASGSERWLNCPGSVKLSEDAPPQEDSPYALEGTHAHKLHDLWARHLRDKMGAFAIPKEFPKRDMIDAVRSSIDHIKTIWKPKDAELIIEEKVRLDHIGEDMYGTTDIGVIEHFGTLDVLDYKHGAGHAVDVATVNPSTKKLDYNTQLLYYAMGLAYKHDYNFQKIRLWIVQPRAYHVEGSIRMAELTVAQLEAYEYAFKKGVERTQKPDAKLYAGKWCKWCPAASFCPEVTKAAFNEAAVEFDEVKTGRVKLPAPESLSPKILAKLLSSAELLDVWIKAVRSHAFGLLQAGKPLPGYKIVRGRKSRDWKDEDKAAAMLEMLFEEAAYKRDLLSVAQAEKLLGPKKFRGLSKYVKQSDGLLTMVADTDKRDGVDVVAESFTEGTPSGRGRKRIKQKKSGTRRARK